MIRAKNYLQLETARIKPEGGTDPAVRRVRFNWERPAMRPMRVWLPFPMSQQHQLL
jgi:hypothetical protein